MNPSTRLLVVVRDPVRRAIGNYTHPVSKKPEMKPFEQLVLLNTSIGSIMDTSCERIKRSIYYSCYLTQKSLKNSN
ncbi:hypothetical protein Zmor_001373 [Zophobas morio]|uniref:Sulfotransferase n=1 Tax=Zophobas morio TaxID=2755281 RepID=A0AA38J8V9_9CUCU|nr:hypothetical protein Zmor_001373 [Zophobas morio]